MKEYIKTHSLYFNILFSGKVDKDDLKEREHLIEANGFEGRVGLLFNRCWIRLFPSFGKRGLLFELRWINFVITLGIADWKE